MAILSRLQVAELALNTFDSVETAITMIAIAEGESNFNTNVEGDSPEDLIRAREQGFDITDANIERARLWNCPDPGETDEQAGVSIGLWQVFLPVWNSAVQQLSGINIATFTNADGIIQPAETDGSCPLITWLKDPQNNADIAKIIVNTPLGFGNWTVYNLPQSHSRSYLNFLPQARQAVAEILAKDPPTPTPLPTPVQQSTLPLILSLGIGALAFGLAVFAPRQRT